VEEFIASRDLAFVKLTLSDIGFVCLCSLVVVSVFSLADEAYPFVFLAISAGEFYCDFLEFLF